MIWSYYSSYYSSDSSIIIFWRHAWSSSDVKSSARPLVYFQARQVCRSRFLTNLWCLTTSARYIREGSPFRYSTTTHPLRLSPFKITIPYFWPKNAKIIDPTFWVNKSTYICVAAAARAEAQIHLLPGRWWTLCATLTRRIYICTLSTTDGKRPTDSEEDEDKRGYTGCAKMLKN